MSTTQTETPSIRRNGDIVLNGKIIGSVRRFVRPIGTERSNGTYRHQVVWDGYDDMGSAIGGEHWARSLAVAAVVSRWVARARS